MINSYGRQIGQPVAPGASSIAGADGFNYDQNAVKYAQQQVMQPNLPPNAMANYQGVINAVSPTASPNSYQAYINRARRVIGTGQGQPQGIGAQMAPGQQAQNNSLFSPLFNS